MNPAFRLMEKELKVYFKTFYTELTYVILFPVLLVGTMGLGLGDKTITVLPYGEYDYILFITPGIALMSVVTTGFFNTGFIMLFEKEYTDTFQGVVTCPISSGEIVFGKIVAGSIKSVLNGLFIIVILVLILGFDAPLTLLLLPVLFFVAALVFSAMGLILGVMLKKGYQLGTIGNLVILPLTFLGGMFFDVNSLPPNLATVSGLSPVTMMVDATKKLMVFGDPNVALEMLAILLTFMVFYAVTVKIFERKIFY